MVDPGDIEAFVLAGGGSRRFGSDKARACIDGVPLVARNAAVLAERYSTVRVVSAPDRSYEDLGLTTIFDEKPGLGPLAGIHAALVCATTETIAVAACDLVGLEAHWYEALEAEAPRAATAFRDDRWHPLVALYHRDSLPFIEARLAAGQLAVRDLLDEIGHAVPPPEGFALLRSANTREQL